MVMVSRSCWVAWLVCCQVLLAASAAQRPGNSATEVSRTDALIKLCQVWSDVKFLDPQLMTRQVDWDGALIRALPHVREAHTYDELATSLGSMLAELNDPATRVVRVDKSAAAKVPLFRWDNDVLVINIGPYSDAEGIDALYSLDQLLPPEMGKAKSVIIDMRAREDVEWALEDLTLVSEPVAVPGFRYVFHSGSPPQSGRGSSGLLLTASPPLEPSRPAKSVPSRVVFVVRSDVPLMTAALWWNGRAAIVSEQPISDSSLGLTKDVEIGGGSTAKIRVAESLAGGIVADAVVAPSADDAPMKKALAIARDNTPFAARSRREVAAAPVMQKDAPYEQMTSPDLPYRLLALFRAWSTIDRFYPYKHLIGDWDAVLREFIPRFEDANDGNAYVRAVMELNARVEDGHSSVWGHPAIREIAGGVFFLPLEIRSVEGKYVVTGKAESLPKETAITIGDEVVSIDGETIGDRVKRFWKYYTASHETARLNRVLSLGTRGAKDSVAELVVRGEDGVERPVKITRTMYSPIAKEGAIWRVLDGNIGYADLTRLTLEQVDGMFDALKGTNAIIFDMRGYPQGTAVSITPRINSNNAQIGATFRRVQISAFSWEMAHTGFYFDQVLPKSDKPRYTGKTVMLIDDRAISQSEHMGLWFESANGTKFIGSNSAGAHGGMDTLVLPGGVYMSFSYMDVRHADGRQLQRIGLVPDVVVTPTIRGLRQGKDEVLDRALSYLRGQ